MLLTEPFVAQPLVSGCCKGSAKPARSNLSPAIYQLFRRRRICNAAKTTSDFDFLQSGDIFVDYMVAGIPPVWHVLFIIRYGYSVFMIVFLYYIIID